MNNLSGSVGDRKEILRVEELEVTFATANGRVPVIQDVSFSLYEGETLGLVGESGSGKTVTSLSLMRLIPSPPGTISKGSITVDGLDMLSLGNRELSRVRGELISMVFQEPMTSLNPVFKIGDQIAEVYRVHRNCSRKEAWARAVEMLDNVQIPAAAKRAHSYPHELSGGMRQRAMIAMALVCNPKILVADEPTTALDVTIQAQILELIAELQRELGMAMILVTHDLAVVAEVCERVVVMYSGQVVESSPIEQIFERPRHPYTAALMEAIPVVGQSRSGLLPFIPGSVALPGSYPSGCRFGPRCQHFVEQCAQPEEGDSSSSIMLRDLGSERLSRCVRESELTLEGRQ